MSRKRKAPKRKNYPDPKYKSEVEETNASFVLLPNDYEDSESKPDQLFIKTESPSLELAKICRLIYGELFSNKQNGVHASAFIDESAERKGSAILKVYSRLA